MNRLPEIQPVNMLGRVSQAVNTAGAMNRIRTQNALQDVYQQHGPGIASGEQGALNALAGVDPMAARSIQTDQRDFDFRRTQADRAYGLQNRQETRLAQHFELEMQEYAASLDAAQAAAEAEQVRMGVQAASTAQTPEQWDAIAMQFNQPELVGQFGMKDALLARFSTAAQILEAQAGPKPLSGPGKVQHDIDAGILPQNTPLRSQTPGFSVTTPNGTLVQQGWQGDTPPGQNPLTTGTPRNGGQLAKELSKDDAATLEEVNAAGRTAADLESLATQLETVAPHVGYTGPGGQVYGFVDDVVGFLPGDSGARGAFKSLAMEAQLTFTEKTKGAITDREMGMFRAAVPNLSQTREGNTAIAQVMKAAAARTQTRAAFFENWARKHGSLEGAQEVWSEYMRDNPLIAEDRNTVKANPEGDWQSYLSRQPAMSYTPESIMQMDLNQLSMVPVEKMTGPQLDALERRFQELNR